MKVYSDEEVPGLVLDHEAETVALDGHDLTGERISIHDCMAAGHCVRGVKRWFAEYEFDFAGFLTEGISAYDFLSTKDGHAIGIVRNKIGRTHG